MLAYGAQAVMAKILVVDDHPQIVRLLQRVLETDGHEIITAADGEKALQCIRLEQPALVLLDVMLPKLDGHQVLTEMKADPSSRQIPVILLSGMDQVTDVTRGLQLGADCCVSKPFRPAEILSLARRFLNL
jgi:DNA-binding response OmpR family regulator